MGAKFNGTSNKAYSEGLHGELSSSSPGHSGEQRPGVFAGLKTPQRAQVKEPGMGKVRIFPQRRAKILSGFLIPVFMINCLRLYWTAMRFK